MQKRHFIIPAIVLTTAAFLFLIETKTPPKPLSFNYTTMGTMLEITVYPETDNSEKTVEKARAEIERLNDKYSTYREESLISRIRQKAPEPLKTDTETACLLKKSQKIHEQTDGMFDPTVGPLVELWGFYRHQGKIPADSEITATKRKVGLDKIFFKDNKIALQPGMRLDFGAFVKGYAVDRAAEIMSEHNEKNFMINLGGNIYAAGSPPEADYWRIGLRDPRDKSSISGSLSLKNEAISTSGDYERMFIIDGERYAHIINPKTGRPVKKTAAVTAIASEALTADFYSTAIFLTGHNRDYIKNSPLNGFMIAKTEDKNLKYFLTENFEKKLLTANSSLAGYTLLK
ncbi:MAG: FAD:protein FMN transferase [bacterium]